MKTISIIAFIAIFFLSPNQAQSGAVSSGESASYSPSIELVFCLDATGSMSGLIRTAKEKIWDIVTVMSQAEPAPDIKLGMIFYRDLGDIFVTKVYPLTDDIDSLYSELLAIEAHGGGDTPESVNQALNEAVTKMGWSTDKQVYRTIFLVGDCPPHMDYDQDIKYPESCKLANKQGVVINTIKLGIQCREAIPHFKAIAEATNGVYQQLGQDAEDVIIDTPYDDSISFYSNKLDESKIYYGSADIQSTMRTKQEAALGLYEKSSKNAVASRAKFSLSKSGAKNFYGENELVQQIIDKEIKLEDIDEDELPENMKKMNALERKAYVAKLEKERAENLSMLQYLSEQRSAYIDSVRSEDPERSSFSEDVFEVVKKQAAQKGVEFVK